MTEHGSRPASTSSQATLLKDFPVDGMLDDMIQFYQKHLNKADVDAMNAFYQSPTGQKMLREMPAMTAESMQASSPRIQAMMDKVMEHAEQLAREERNKKTQTEQPATKRTNEINAALSLTRKGIWQNTRRNHHPCPVPSPLSFLSLTAGATAPRRKRMQLRLPVSPPMTASCANIRTR